MKMAETGRRAPRNVLRAAVVTVALAGALIALVMSTRPSPRLGLDTHWRVFGAYAIGAAMLMLVALASSGRRYRWAVAILSIFALAIATLVHPVCVPIPKIDQPSFETVTSLEEHARRGEPFCRFGTTWYQCKSYVSRAFFF